MRGLCPYPYFGSKAAVAGPLWEAFGPSVANYIEPFAGSCSVLLSRPSPGKIETVNDAHAFLPNFWRAIKADPDGVADAALWPVSEIDMHARHDALMRRADEAWREQLRDDADFYDVEMAGWWVWGASIWIGSGWCDEKHLRKDGKTQRRHQRLRGRDGSPQGGRGVARENLPRSQRKRPAIGGRGARPNGKNGAHKGVGIQRDRLPHLIGPHNGRKHPNSLPGLSGSDGSGVGYGRGIFASGRREDLRAYFRALAERFASVRVTCGDWTRVVTPAVTISHGTTAILLDPPYAADRSAKLYAQDSMTVSADVRKWALEHGDDRRYRIALCGYEGEHEMPDTWRCFAWKAQGGYGNQSGKNTNASRERIWFSPWCLGGERVAGPLFAHVEAS